MRKTVVRKQVIGKSLSGSLANAVSASGRLFTVCMVLGVMRSLMENLGLNRFQAVLDQVSRNQRRATLARGLAQALQRRIDSGCERYGNSGIEAGHMPSKARLDAA